MEYDLLSKAVVTHSITKISRLGGYRRLIHKVGCGSPF